ncbi:MAG: phosphomannomutase/phosphoglucomutase [Gemmatimonadaceae bacterium]|nr:phosphomannomutase/phosphoglucomutase [Gemmatimonadaceae bacterium]
MTLSREIFRQYDVRGIVGRDLTADTAYVLGCAYAAYLKGRNVTGSVAVGRDNRPSGGELRDALVRGLTECGLNVVDVGQVPTPLLYWALNHVDVAGGIQVTGSHNPPEYNGFKLSLGTESIHGGEIQSLYALAVAGVFPSGKGTVRTQSIIDSYVEDIVARTGKLDRRLKVVVDCGNGVGALVAPQLFDALDVEWTGLFCESDGTFPNHHPDPTVVENLQDLIKAVRDTGADLGVGFDGDADRIGVVDADGNIVWGDHVLILYARDVLERTGPGQPIVFDVKCSQALPDEIRKAKGVPVMWKTGHSLMKDKMHELHAPVGGEMSGHMFFTEGFYGHDDALYGAARLIRIVAASGKSLSGMLSNVPKFVSTPELRVDVEEARKFGIVEHAIAHFRETHEVIDVDGARVLFGDGWGLIRASNTQPVLVTRYEARTDARLAEIRGEMEQWLRSQGVSP